MKNSILLIIVLASLTVHIKAQIKSKDLPQKKSDIYFLDYYYQEDPNKIIFSRATSRIVIGDTSFCFIDYNLKDITKISSSSCLDFNGVPIQYGREKEITKIFKQNVHLNFKGRDTTFAINSKKELQNMTSLWFLKFMPSVNETVIVSFINKNYITNTIDKVSVSYTYLGKQKLKILDENKNFHRVKSFPINGSEGTYDERWYDNKGMLVKEKHIVGKNGVRVAILSRVVKQ